MTITRRSAVSHLAAFLLGVLAGAAVHPCTILTSNPPTTGEPTAPDEPAVADSSSGP